MARFNVTPMNRSSMWKVEKNGRRVSKHRKQSTAIRKARRKARTGDQLVIHGRDGTIRESTTVR